MGEIKLVIPKEIAQKYNHSLAEHPKGDNTLIGNEEALRTLQSTLFNYDLPNATLIGEQGTGKTATIEHMNYLLSKTDKPILIVSLSIEVLGELEENVMIGRMKSLLADMNTVRKATEKHNKTNKFFMALFIDEVHKLYKYGLANESSGAMNALKESMARAEFPTFFATTDYEYRENISKDLAFVRRLNPVVLSEPSKAAVLKILERKLEYWEEKTGYLPKIAEGVLEEIYDLSVAHITEQANPAKSIAILSTAISYCLESNQLHNEAKVLDHSVVAVVFRSKGYEIDVTTTTEDVGRSMRGIKGQPLAIKAIMDAVSASLNTTRNILKPLMTLFLVGTTGTGKTETAKALAEAFFGSRDKLLVVNGGDYSTKNDAKIVLNYIADSMINEKRKVILLDEVEKFHKNVLFALMRMIDEGLVKDSNDIEYSVRSTIIAATSNLGATVFSELASTMELNTIDLPDNPPKFEPNYEERLLRKIQVEPDESRKKELENHLSTFREFKKLELKWYLQEASVRKALLAGDAGQDNGIKPEFLERFSMFIPFLPLTRKTMATIARMKLVSFQKEMLEQQGIIIQLIKPLSKEKWREKAAEYNYDSVDQVSVMIAEDIVNEESETAGARTIERFIETSVKPKVGQLIDYRRRNGESMDGAFAISTNGGAVFEAHNNEIPPDVKVTFRRRGE